MMKHRSVFFLLFFPAFLLLGCTTQKKLPQAEEAIKGYCLDFNWGEGGPNAFAAPGLWADADPKEHIKWYKDLGVNVVQTFIVSCNGYAWYKDGPVPPQPGLEHDFLPEMVQLGHQEGMQVMGYLCIGSNTRWGQENPDYSYDVPATRHIPYTRKYLAYLDTVIRDAVQHTGIDGFMIDWFYQPQRKKNVPWLESEKERYEELMGEPFPGVEKVFADNFKRYDEYSRRAIDAAWDVIYKAAKETNPDCIIWLTCYEITHPHIVNSKMFRQVDWLMNEAGDLAGLEAVTGMVGEHTRLITCLADWNNQDAVSAVKEAAGKGIGLYGFAKPNENSLLPPMNYYLSTPLDSMEGDDRNIATFARYYNELPLDYLKE
jgi:hypothetical protein